MKFGIVGVSNTVLSFAVYALLLKVFGLWYVAASAIAFAVGAVNGFLLNRRWTFKEHVGDALTPVRWAVVQSCGLALNLGLVYVFVDDLSLDKLIGQACATAIVTVLAFFANRAWTFRMHPPVADSAQNPFKGVLSETRRAGRGRRGCARRARSARPPARAGARAAS